MLIRIQTWQYWVGSWYGGHDDTVGPLGGVQEVPVGVVEFVDRVITMGQAHSHRETKQSGFIVMNAIPVCYNTQLKLQVLQMIRTMQLVK